MKSEDDLITDDEGLLRRVRKERFRTTTVAVISPNAFEPRTEGRDPDIDGISFYREQCLADAAEILAAVVVEKRAEIGIVRVSVSFLKSLGLTVVSKPVPGIKGHIVIPELNAADYKQHKARFTPIKEKLAAEASLDANIVRYPSA